MIASLYELYNFAFDDFFLVIILTPVFIFLTLNPLFYYDYDKLLLKYYSIKTWWTDKFKALTVLILIYVTVLNLIYLFSILFNGLIGYFTVPFALFFISTCVLQIFGYLFISFLFLTIYYILNYKIISGFITYLVIIMPSIIEGVFYKEVISLLKIMYFKNPERYSYLQSLLILSVGLIFIVFLNFSIIKKKDIYWSSGR